MHTRLGIIEGFYGIKYTDRVRFTLMRRAREQGYSFYIYAPKNESALRSRWSCEYSPEFAQRLRQASRYAHSLGLDFGFGLSPLNLSSNFEQEEEIFCAKISSLLQLCAPELVCLLFDDVKVDKENQARMQNRIIRRLLTLLPDTVRQVIVCPTFYSFDPILEKLFGRRSEHYFTDFMADLPEKVSVFWTGNRVLSEDITEEDIKAAISLLGPNLSLWDNYPVNDGRKLCEKLFLKPFKGRRGLDGLCQYHAVNPMNEGLLSTLPLASLPLIYQGESDEVIEQRMQAEALRLFGRSLERLRPYLKRMNNQGLSSLSLRERNRIISWCQQGRFAAAAELQAYLKEVYTFDPDCLTS